jgi:hypothetical protein
MADSSDKNAKEADPLMDIETEDDNITVVTATTATKTNFIEQEMDDSIIRYEIADTYVIVLVGISRDIMTALKPTLLQGIQSIIAVSDTNRTDHNGRWNVLVKEKGFTTTRKYIAKNLPIWLRSYQSTIHETTPDHFPAPQVSQKHADVDDDSSGQASYMSSCAQSYGSMEDLEPDEALFYSPDSRDTTPSYADIVKKTNQPNTTQHQTPSGTSIEFNATDRELRAIIATLQNEVHQLKNWVPAQTLPTPSTVTEATGPDSTTTKLSSRMDTFETNVTKWMSNISIMINRNQHEQSSTTMVEAHHHQQKWPPTHSPPRRMCGSVDIIVKALLAKRALAGRGERVAILDPVEIGSDQSDGDPVGNGSSRLLVIPAASEPSGKVTNSRVSSRVVRLTYVAAVSPQEISLAKLDSS